VPTAQAFAEGHGQSLSIQVRDAQPFGVLVLALDLCGNKKSPTSAPAEVGLWFFAVKR
jgi:hypothetical protein